MTQITHPSNPIVRRPTRTVQATCAALAAFAFGYPAYELIRFSFSDSLYSHLPLIPLVSAYFLYLQWRSLPPVTPPDRLLGVAAACIAAFTLGRYAQLSLSGGTPVEERLGWAVTALTAGTAAYFAWFHGRGRLVAAAFPIGFLLFAAPLPLSWLAATETFLQHGSAVVAAKMLELAGMPVLRDDLLLILPGFSMQVAPECSGIRSTLALLITSTAASFLFLRSPTKRLILVLAVVPLALLRNGFRIFVLGELCVRVGPHMIDSFIHHHGGPIFFALSLIPFGLLLLLLYRSDARAPSTPNAS